MCGLNRRQMHSEYACHSKHVGCYRYKYFAFVVVASFFTSFSLLFPVFFGNFFVFFFISFSANRFMFSCRQLPPVEINYIQFSSPWSTVTTIRLIVFLSFTHFLTSKLHRHLNSKVKMLSTRHQLCSQLYGLFFFLRRSVFSSNLKDSISVTMSLTLVHPYTIYTKCKHNSNELSMIIRIYSNYQFIQSLLFESKGNVFYQFFFMTFSF